MRNISRKIIKVTVALVLVVLMSLGLLCSCGDSNEGAKCTDIMKACSAIADEGTFDIWVGSGEEIYEESFSTMYGVESSMVDDGAILYTEAGGVADEISIMHLKKSDDMSIAKTKMQDRINERRKVFAGYKPEEVTKLDNATVMVQGDYIALIVSDNNQNFETEIRRVISEGAE